MQFEYHSGSHPHKVRLIAFYLPQYHPIPENDEWWGSGFTEWTNVAKARPLFRGHAQPLLPGELGFYDLRVPEVREAQAALAKKYGVEAFCYWHYWFGGGKRLLERPFAEVLDSGKPDFPFCLAWANHTWSGIWHGCPDRVLIEQSYPGESDWVEHFYEVLPAFKDHRYVRVDGKAMFVIYNPSGLPDIARFIACWQRLACENGINGIYFVGITTGTMKKTETGLDAITSHPPGDLVLFRNHHALERLIHKLTGFWTEDLVSRLLLRPQIYDYESLTRIENYERFTPKDGIVVLPCVLPNWDNSPRSGRNGIVLSGSTPALFKRNLQKAVDFVVSHSNEEKIIFIKSWNEWAEGNILEPDSVWGDGYLRAVRESLEGATVGVVR